MILSTSQYSVDGTSVKIVSTAEVARVVYIHGVTSTEVYMGPTSGVTTATGFYLDKSAGPLQIQLDANDELWAISPSGTHTVTVMQVTL